MFRSTLFFLHLRHTNKVRLVRLVRHVRQSAAPDTHANPDSGCGIPPEDQSQVFKRFFRSDVSRHLQGNGLGLSLVKAIVKAHKWQIGLVSTPGEGSLFTVTLPCSRES